MRNMALKDLCIMKSGGTPSRKNPSFYEGEIPWAKISDLEFSPDGYIHDTKEHITQEALASINNRFFDAGTLFLAMYGSVGKTGISKIPMTTNQAILGINIKEKDLLDIDYLKYWFKTIKQRLLNRAVGAALPNISLTIVKELKIPLPPLDQQKKIAAILDAADAYRQKTKALIKKYDALTQSLFLDMFGDRSKFNRIKLSQCVTEKNDFVDGPFGSNLKVSHQTPSGVRLIQINNIGVGEFRDKKKKFTSEKKYFELIRHSVQPGDIIIAKMGEPLGRACLVPDYIEKGLVVADCMRMRMTSSKFLKHFVMFFLNSNDAKAQIGNLSKGSTRIRINLSMIRTLEIPAPSIELQNQFADSVQAIEEQKTQAQASLAGAEDLFNSLLQRAFKGELV